MELHLSHLLGVYGTVLVASVGWAIKALRSTASKEDLEKAMLVANQRIDQRVEQVEFVQVIRRLDDKMDALSKDHERLSEDVRELRRLLEQLLQQGSGHGGHG